MGLAFALSENDPPYLDHSFYPAPPPFERLPLPEIERRAARLAGAVAGIARTGEERRLRRIAASIEALHLRTRVRLGEPIPQAARLRGMFGLEGSAREPDGERLRFRVDRAIPGVAPLRVRVRRYHEDSLEPPEDADAFLRSALADCREALPGDLPVPLEPLRVQWLAPGEARSLPTGLAPFFRYLGDGRGILRIPAGAPFRPAEFRRLACHEGVPGHLLQAALAEAQFRTLGHPELGIVPLYDPRTAVFEGLAAAAERVVPASVADEALRGLEPVIAGVLADYLDGRRTRLEAVRALDFEGFVPDPHALLAHADRFGSYALVRPAADPRFQEALGGLLDPRVSSGDRLRRFVRAVQQAMHPRELMTVLSDR